MKCNKPIWLEKINKYTPCGKCIPCKKLKSQEWAERLNNDAPYYKKSVFITLTYENSINDHLYKNHMKYGTENYSLSRSDLQKFLKRLRKRLTNKISYYCSGEYGILTKRPHYHLIILGLGLGDLNALGKLTIIGKNKKEDRLSSEWLKNIWQFGYNEVAPLTKNRIYYSTGYLIEKKWGDHGKEIYQQKGIEEPFGIMSKGIGKLYYEENKDEIYQNYLNNKRVEQKFKTQNKPISRYYIKLLEQDGYHLGKIKEEALNCRYGEKVRIKAMQLGVKPTSRKKIEDVIFKSEIERNIAQTIDYQWIETNVRRREL